MKWKKLGLIFCPNNNFGWMTSHASIPIAELIKNDLFRINFSTRNSYNKSHVGYIEIDIMRPQHILKLSSQPILTPGHLGTFDENGAMLSCIVKTNTNYSFYYYIGWNLGTSVPFRNAIGLAIGNNDNLKKYSTGPILDRSIYDPCFVASPYVILDNSIWKMWYLSCIKWETTAGEKPKHWYNIKYAESKDGILWERNGEVSLPFISNDEYAISRPCILKDNLKYKMWYSYRGKKYRIGYAESPDGMHWQRMDEQAGIGVSKEGWDSEMIEYPFVFDHKGNRYMLYNGNGYGKTGFGLAILEND